MIADDFKIDFKSSSATEDFLVPIAWGYLKPVGYSQTYLGKLKIQLYKYELQQLGILRKEGQTEAVEAEKA